MIEVIVREVITKYSYHLSDACVEELVDKLGNYLDTQEDSAFWAGRDSRELY